MKRVLLSIFVIISLVFNAFSSKKKQDPFTVSSAELVSENLIRLKCSGLNEKYTAIKFSITPEMKIVSFVRKGPFIEITTEKNFEEDITYTLAFDDPNTKSKGSIGISTTFLVEKRFNDMWSDKELGYTFKDGISTFRLFAPRATKVNLIIFDKYDDEKGRVIEMKNDGNQVFEYQEKAVLWGKYYGYQIVERKSAPKSFLPTIPHDTIFADPYGKINASNNVYPMKYRTLIYDTSKFDWQGVKSPGIDMDNLIIMEAHIRDLTAHPSAKSKFPGTYKGLIEAEVGGLKYLKNLGINAIEFLPLHDFCNVEAPYKEKAFGFRNTWNVYSRNYWGYMTNNYFVPETYYATDGVIDPKKWNGTDGRAVDEMKYMVRELHRNGIAVIMDVVYNHVSQYDENALKIIDWDFYFKKADKTGCGNEVETRRKMVRRLVIDSLKYWMTEYHIDGFRFDLAASHDVETIQAIYDELRKINPKVYLIAEPWGGEGASNKNDYKRIGWSFWNDGIRGAIRGGNNRPTKPGTSFMLGNANNASQLAEYWKGTNTPKSYQSVNYIESHDDATLGDIVRILSGAYSFKDKDGNINRIKDIKAYLKFSPELVDAYKVGATALFLAKGPIMLHLGQEWGRGKITPDLSNQGIEELTTKGEIGASSDNVVFLTPTPNSYSADNETNYINYEYISLNQEVFDYYQGLIKLRKAEPIIGNAKPDQVEILNNENKNSLGCIIDKRIIGIVNSDKTKSATYTIPEGTYRVVVDKKKAGTDTIREINGGTITVEPASSLILIKK